MRQVAGAALLIGLASGCSEPPYPLPDRGTPAVRDEERRLAALLPDELLWGTGTCKVRLLGTEGTTSFGWADCDMAATSTAPAGGVSLPVRVDEERVTTPVDGAGYSASIERMFPARLADAVLRDPQRLRP